jgi:hypothetical protein
VSGLLYRIRDDFGGRVRVCRADVARNSHSAAAVGIRSIPAILVYHQGRRRSANFGTIDPGVVYEVLEGLLPEEPPATTLSPSRRTTRHQGGFSISGHSRCPANLAFPFQAAAGRRHPSPAGCNPGFPPELRPGPATDSSISGNTRKRVAGHRQGPCPAPGRWITRGVRVRIQAFPVVDDESTRSGKHEGRR